MTIFQVALQNKERKSKEREKKGMKGEIDNLTSTKTHIFHLKVLCEPL
jgi:hypothetical protein